MSVRLPSAVSLLAATAFLSACAGGSPAASEVPSTLASASAAAEESAAPSVQATPGTALSACEMVTADDVSTVLGDLTGETVEVADGEERDTPTVLDPAASDCRYQGDWGGLVVNLTPTDGANLYDAVRGTYADAADVEIAGADSAFWSADQTRGFFWKGAVNVMLQFTHLTVNVDWKEATTGIGAAAIGKL